MPRNGLITFGDIDGKLTMLRIECAKCGRKGRYSVARLLEQYGPDEPLETFRRPLIENCPRYLKRDYNDQCDAIFPDLIKVV
jgi:hypothetical protein